MTELEFPHGLRALHFHPERRGEPIVALHGWLDNAMSFAALAETLERPLIALELPGHGHSAWLPAGSWYHLLDNLEVLLAALDHLKLERTCLLGHSMGGALASILAGALPARIDRLVLIEALGPLSYAAEQGPTHLARALAERAGFKDKQRRVFDDPNRAIAARMQANGLSEPAARALIERALEAVPGGYRWRSDPRLTVPSVYRLTEPQVLAMLRAIKAPTLFIHATPETDVFKLGDLGARRSAVSDLTSIALPGHHHLHMESPEPVSAAINAFLRPV